MTPTPARTNGGEEPADLEALLRLQIEQTARLTEAVQQSLSAQSSSEGHQVVRELAELMQAASTRSVADSTNALAEAVAQMRPAQLTEAQYDLLADYEALRTELGRTKANGMVRLAWSQPDLLQVVATLLPSTFSVLVNGRFCETALVTVHGDETRLVFEGVDLPADGLLVVEVRSGGRPIRRGRLVLGDLLAYAGRS